MKKFISLALAALTAVTLALPTSAANVEKLGSNSVATKATISGVSTVAQKLDGVITDYEYAEIKYTADDMRYMGADDAYVAEIQKYTFKMYAAYDANYMYIAVVCSTPNYKQDKAASSMYLGWSLQFSGAKTSSTGTERFEYGFAKNDKGEYLFNAWMDSFKFAWKPVGGTDYVVSTVKDVTTYEAKIPAKAWGVDSFKKGDAIKMNFCMNVGHDSAKRGQIEWSQGIGDGKDAAKMAVCTLGDAIVIPAKKTTAAATADVVSYVVAAMAVSAAAVFAISKKR